MSELSPAQLDQLEDALEDLELGGAGSGLDPLVESRLGEYQQVLSLCRDAMPLQDVRPGLLDGVLAEAQASAPVAATAAQSQDQDSGREPWWKRFRLSVWVPALAVAGSAALVLLLVRPAAEQESASMSGPIAQADAPPAAAAKAEAAADANKEQSAAAQPEIASEAANEILRDGLADASVEEARRGRLRFGDEQERGVAADEPSSAAEPEPEPEPVPEQKRDRKADDAELGGLGKIGGKGKRQQRPPSSPSKASGGSSTKTPKPNAEPQRPSPKAPASTPAKPGAVEEVTGAMSAIASGDKFRQKGDCGRARKKYASVRKDGSAEVRGRALAGLGLCELAAGHTDSAESLFRQARLASPKVGSFISRERKKIDADNAQSRQDQAGQADQAVVEEAPNQAL